MNELHPSPGTRPQDTHMQADDHEIFPALLAGDPPYRFLVFEHLLDLCWSHTANATKPGATPPPACPLLALHSNLEATQTYFAHPSHALDPPPARIAQVESETESMVDMFQGLLRKDVREVEQTGMHTCPAGKALVAHAQGILSPGPAGDGGVQTGNRRASVKGSGALTMEEVMIMLSCF